jgi:IS605 OrfB family transposase
VPNAIVGQVESHIELHGEQHRVGLPTIRSLRPKNLQYADALAVLSRATTKAEEDAARDQLATVSRPGLFRPLLFGTNRKADGFLLLREEATRRYFVWLNLVPSSSRFARFTAAESREKSCRRVRGLTDLRTGEVVSFQSKTGCLFPVEFGRDFQLDEFICKGSPLAAKLTKSEDRYEVHVSFEYEVPKVETTSFLGVDRGIYNLASLAVVDPEGRVIERKNVDGRELRYVQKLLERRQRKDQRAGRPFRGRAKLHAADEAVHKAANEIVAAAVRHRSQTIMENLAPLASRGKKRARSSFNRVLNRSQYQKLRKVLDYKLKLAGLPPPREVHPGHTSRACPMCGHIAGENRLKIAAADGFKVDSFRCVACKFEDDADLNAARNIALKQLWRSSLSPALKTKLFQEVPESKNFTAFLRTRAELRGERPCDRKVGSSGGAGLDGHEDGEVPPGGGVADTVRPLSLTPGRTPRQEKIASAKPPTDSSSSEILPRPETKQGEFPDG